MLRLITPAGDLPRRRAALAGLALLSLTTSACGQNPPATTAPPLPGIVRDSAGRPDLPWLRQRLDSSRVLRRQQVGVALADAATGEVLFGYNEARYFTPASTMKLLTVAGGLALLGDSLPALRYFSRGDTLFFQGTGDPTLLHGDVPGRRAYAWLAARPERVLAYCDIATVPAYGPSWAWDDFGYYFQPERTAFPLYGNTVRFYGGVPVAGPARPGQPPTYYQRVRVVPRQFGASTTAAGFDFHLSPDQDKSAHVLRAPLENRFTYRPAGKRWVDEVPYRTSRALLVRLLADTLRRAVVGIGPWHPRPGLDSIRTLAGLPADSLYRRMLRVSDNFLAEQTLLMASTRVGYHDSLSTQRVIRFLLKNQLRGLPDLPDWVDGSGLSHLNLLTPRTLTAVLVRLHQQLPEARLLSLLAAGGGPGTLKRRYFDAGPPKMPWFWGKTGTLTHTANLAGYLRCRSGRLVAVTFFNNGIAGSDQRTRDAMQWALSEVRQRL